MKYQLPVLLFAAAAQCWTQLPGAKGTQFVEPKYRLSIPHKRAIFTYGSIRMKAKNDKSKSSGTGGFSLDSNGQGGSGTITTGLCSDCTIISGRYIMTDASTGAKITPDQVYIHHFVSSVKGVTVQSPIQGCMGNFGSGEFVDAGQDSGDTDTIFSSANGTYNSGFHMPSPNLHITYDLVNLLDKPVDINIGVEIEWLQGKVGKSAGHSLKSVACGNQGLTGPKLKAEDDSGNAWTTSSDMTITKDTKIVWARGHVHMGGVQVDLLVNNAVACSSKAQYDAETGQIVTMGICPKPIQLFTGDKIKVRSLYNIQKHPLRKSTDGTGKHAHSILGGSDVMGMMAMTYAIGNDGETKSSVAFKA